MFRGIVAITLVVSIVANHLVTVPHAHGMATTDQQKQHDATPHFHVTWLNAEGHGHSHSGHHHDSHSHVHHRHSHAADTAHEGQSEKHNQQPVENCITQTQHDGDAVFVSPLDVSTHRAAASPSQDLNLISLTPVFFTLEDLVVVLQPSPRWHPPDKVLDDSEIFLTMQNLRI